VSQAADDRDGIVRQKATITQYADRNGIRIVKWFVDSITGRKELENRPALQALMIALHSNGTRLVIIEKLDRLARDLMIQESIFADFQRNGFEICSVAEPDLCSNDPTRKLLRQMMGAFSEYERTMIVQKLLGARQRARANNPAYQEGRKPYGDRLGEPQIIARIMDLRGKGRTIRDIADTLNAEGCKPRSGEKWWPASVRNVILRAEEGA
jgi:DNA invertase Pin-like site-specific DNA recombinase